MNFSYITRLLPLLIVISASGNTGKNLDPLLTLLDLPADESYFASVQVRNIPSDKVREIFQSGAPDTDISKSLIQKYFILYKNGSCFIQKYEDESKNNLINSFYAGSFSYQLISGGSYLYFSDSDSLLNKVTFFAYIDSLKKSFKLDNQTLPDGDINELTRVYNKEINIKIEYDYYIPTAYHGQILEFKLISTFRNKTIFELTNESISDLGKNIIKIHFELNQLSFSLPDEIFTPNGFGDMFLVNSNRDFRLFVRDFLPSSEELKVLMTSEEAKREYEAEARNRPRVGPINKYSQKLDISKFK